MRGSQASRQQPPHVMVQFGDGAHSFLLPPGATLGELANRINDLAARHEAAPIAIYVELDTCRSPPPTTTIARNPKFN